MRFCADVPAEEFDAFARQHPQCTLLQSDEWAHVKGGWSHILTGLRNDDGELVAVGLVLIRSVLPSRLRRSATSPLAIWYLPHGPLLDYANDEVRDTYLRQLGRYARRKLAILVRIDPFLAAAAASLDEFPLPPDPQIIAIGRRIERLGYRLRRFTPEKHDNIQPHFVSVVHRPDGEYAALLSKKARTLANNARNRFVTTEYGGDECVDDLVNVIEQTEETKGISLRSAEYYHQIFRSFGENARIYTASLDIDDALARTRQARARDEAELAQCPEHAGKKRNRLTEAIQAANKRIAELSECRERDGQRVVLAAVLVVRFGEWSEMLYAGTNRHYGNIPAQHVLWVDAITEEFACGAQRVSLGGVAGKLDDSLMQFKSRFNPVVIEKIGEFELSIIPPLSKIIDWRLTRH
ncbi:peptidoglycan bridge formation glycyltransferase FemA/FemB family protein [Trueperella sp. LYQ143]|uniref:peptidoglycan bridge formation glycyltransferase FemA/FemB family protein n=1 Tax=Trueperella sp. LYQ143 TaxID=3391059 RepID=UPI0039837928